jgi:cyanophycinase
MSHRNTGSRGLFRNAFWFACLASVANLAAAQAYTYSYLGDPQRPVRARPVSCFGDLCSPSVAMVGGGYDVGEAFRWLIARAGVTKNTGGRFVIIRATGSDAYNPYVFSRLGTIDATTSRNYENVGGADLGLTSVETLVIPDRKAAADPFVLTVVAKASAVFIAGGDQADYYNYWKGTPLDGVLQVAINKGIPIGGTSAGTAVLGEYAFVALVDGVTTSEALTDPYNQYMTIDPLNVATNPWQPRRSFLSIPALKNTIVDTHTNTRGRLGRQFAFIARIGNGCPQGVERYDDILSIGVDEETAVLVSGTPGRAKAELVVNPYNPENTTASYAPQNSAYFARLTRAPYQCAAGKPLVDNNGFQVFRMSAQPAQPSPFPQAPQYSFKSNAVFNLAQWTEQVVKTYADGSSLNGPYYYGTANGAITGKGYY